MYISVSVIFFMTDIQHNYPLCSKLKEKKQHHASRCFNLECVYNIMCLIDRNLPAMKSRLNEVRKKFEAVRQRFLTPLCKCYGIIVHQGIYCNTESVLAY